MNARDGVGSEMRSLIRQRRLAQAKLEDVVEQRAELMQNPKVARYVSLHAQEQAQRDELTHVERRIVELAALLQEAL
jgi:hypothetical protein